MRESTETAVAAILASDNTVDTQAAAAALRMLKGERTPEDDRPMRRRDVAALFGVSPVTVTTWARLGYLDKIVCGKHGRAVAYSRKSVYKLLDGGIVKGGAK